MVIIFVGHFHDLHIEELWISCGVGNHLRHISVHEIANSLQAEKSMMMFHAISGRDAVSSFLGKWKKPIGLHGLLVLLTSSRSPRNQTKIEIVVITMYSRTCTLRRVNEAMKQLSTPSGLRLLRIYLQLKLFSFNTWKEQCTKQVMCGHKFLYQICPVLSYGDRLQLTRDGSRVGLTDQKLQSPVIICCTVAVRRDANASVNVRSQVFNAQSYVVAGRHVATPDFNWGILMLKYYSQMSGVCILLKLRNY